jgi:hypothetical protein
MYVEQSHPHDISRDLAERHQVRFCKSIDEAITFGTDRLRVAGVLARCLKLAAAGGGKTETPELDFGYHTAPWPFANHPNSRLLLPHD